MMASVSVGVIDVEIIELAGRAEAAEVLRIGLDLGLLQEAGELGEMMVGHLLFDAVGTETVDLASDIELRLIDGIAQGFARISAHNEMAALRHEGRHMADRAADHDIDALHRDAAARGGIALDDQEPAIAGRTRRLASIAVDAHDARHHVFGDTWTRMAMDEDFGMLVHAAAIEAGMAADLDHNRGIETAGNGMLAHRVLDQPV